MKGHIPHREADMMRWCWICVLCSDILGSDISPFPWFWPWEIDLISLTFSFVISEIHFPVILSNLFLKALQAPQKQGCVLPTLVSSAWLDLRGFGNVYPYCPKKERPIYLKATVSMPVSLSLPETFYIPALVFFSVLECTGVPQATPPPGGFPVAVSQDLKVFPDRGRLRKLIHSVFLLVHPLMNLLFVC